MIEIFAVETGTGSKRISMRSTGKGAWITVDKIIRNPIKRTVIRPVRWIARASEIVNMLG